MYKGRRTKEMKKIIIGFLLVCLTLLICTYPVQAATPAEINSAITSGMTWLAAQQNPAGSWGTFYQVGKTGFAVLKFETHAIQNSIDPLNPSYQYYTQVRNGLDYIFANAYIMAISPQPAGDPDTNGNGIGVYFSFGSMRTYETSIAMMAIAASTHPEMVVNVLGSAVDGWTYEEVLQDAVDYLAFGQNDVGLERGGWGYSENQVGFSSNTNTGYAVRGLAYAEAPTLDGKTGFACTIPTFVRDELNIWIDYIQNDVGVGNPTDDGGSGYTNPDIWVNILKTGNLLFEMAFYGDWAATQRVLDAIDYLVRHWNDANDDPGWKGFPASYQAMYTTMKAFEMLGIYEIDGIDWQADFADVLVAEQNPDGSWPPCIWDDGERILSTEWALLTLQGIDITAPAIFILSPENKTYSVEDVPLNFTVDEVTSWMGYGLDGQANATITGNTTLTGLLDGSHYVVVYANDTVGNMGASSTVYFTVDPTPPNITDVSQTPTENNVLSTDAVKVNATVTDDTSGVKQVTLDYTNGNGTWITVNMTNLVGNVWNATIPAFPYSTNVTYRIVAEDNMNNTITTEDLGYEYQYIVIPEFPLWTSILLVFIVLIAASAIHKRR